MATAAAGEGPSGPSRAAVVLAAALLATACGSRPGAAPRPTSITPDRAGAAAPVPVRIRGEGFGAQVSADFGGDGGGVVDARFQAFLGATALEDVALRQDGSLAATVPAGLAAGAHDLTVVDPAGRAGTLPQAYRVLDATPSTVQVARFQVEPLGPQTAYAPFTVAVAAVDAEGALVADFQGEVLLSDLSGAVVPPSVGLFVDGRWTGTVEVRTPHAADVLVVSDAGGATGTSAAFDVRPPAPAAVRLDSAAPVIRAGACTGPVTVSLGDAFGFPTTASAPVALSVAATPAAGFALHVDAGCATAGTPVVPAGEGSVSFWFVATAAGPLELTASAPALTPDALSATVVAGPPAVLVFTTPPRTAAAGACSEAVTVEARDAWGNPSSEGGVAVALAAAPPSGFSFFADGACGAPAAAVAIPPGAAAASLWFRGTAAGTVGITASAPGVAAASQDAVVVAAGAEAIAFATPARAAAAGACSAALVVEARDALGNPAPAARPVRLTLTASPDAGFVLYADAACTTVASGATIAAGATGTVLHYRGTVAGEVTVTATAPRLGGASQLERVEPAAPAAVLFATAPQTVPVGACSGAVALVLQDAFGNATGAPAGLAVALGGSPAGLTFSADAACSVPITAIAVPAGSGAATFHVRATAVGPFLVTAAATGVASASQAVTVVPAAPSRLAFTTAAQRVPAGSCSGAVTLEVRDDFDDPVPLSGTAAMAIALAAPGLTLYADAGCTGSAVSVASLPAGASAVSFWFRGTAAGPATVTASAAGVAAADQTEAIVPAAASALVFTTAAQVVTAGSCSGAATVESRDAYGNPAPVSPTAPTIVSLAAPGLAVYADPACATAAVSSLTLAAAATRATFWFRGAVAGPAGVTASAGGLAPASQTETIVPAAPSRLAFTTAAQVVTAGACSAVVTVESRDGQGNPSPPGAAATVVTLGASGLTFFADAGCAGAAVTSVSIPAAGTTASFHVRGTVAGPATITASALGVTPASQTESIVPAPASQLVFSTPAQVVTAGACSAAVTVEARDAFGNPAPPSNAVATAVTLAAAGLGFFPDAACAGAAVTSVSIPPAGTTASFHLRGTVVGPATVTVAAAGLASASQVETIAAAPATQLAFATPAQAVIAGSCSAVVTVESRDGYGNPSRPGAVALAVALTAPGLTLFADAACAGAAVTSVSIPAAGVTASFYLRGTVAGPATVTVTAAGLASASQPETIVAAAASQLAFVTPAQTVTAGACSGAVTVEARDAFGNPSALSPSTATAVALAAPGLTPFADAACAGAGVTSVSMPAAGTAASFYLRGIAAGTATVTASATGVAAASQAEVIVPAAASQLAFVTAAQTVTAGACSGAVTVEARDAFGNPSALSPSTATAVALAAPGLTLFADAACAGAGVTSVSMPAAGTAASFYLRGTAAGTATVTASATGVAAASQPETIVPAAASQLAFVTPAQTVTAGSCSGTVTVEARDAFGNPSALSPSTATAVALVAPGLTLFADAACAGAGVTSVSIPAAGATASFYLRGAVAGPATVTVTTAGLSSATQPETIVAAAASQLAFVTAAQTVTAGSCSGAVTVEARDAYGNPVALSPSTATAVALVAPGLTLFADAACAGAAVTSVSLPATATAATFRFRGTTAGTPTVTASAAGVAAASQAETIAPAAASQLAFVTAAQTVRAGACSEAVTVEARDAYGNASALSPSTATAVALVAPGLTLFADAACAGAPVTAASIPATGTSASFHLRGTTAGTPMVTVSTAGVASASQPETVVAAAASQLAFVTPAQTVTAGSCSAAVTVEARDAWGNAAEVSAVLPTTISVAAGALMFHADAACATLPVTAVTLPAGATSVTFHFSGTAAGTSPVTASATGITAATQGETLVAAAATQLAFSTPPRTIPAGGCSAPIAVEARDPWGNPGPVSGALDTPISLAGSGLTLFASAGCGGAGVTSLTLAAGTSTATLHFSGTLVGPSTLTVTAAGLSGASQGASVLPADATRLAFVTGPGSAIAGACSPGVTLESRDAWDNPTYVSSTAATVVDLSAAGLTFYTASDCSGGAVTSVTLAPGASRATFHFRGATAGTVGVTASAAGLSSTTQDATIVPGPVDHLAWATIPSPQLEAVAFAVTITAVDAHGNLAAWAGPATLSASSGAVACVAPCTSAAVTAAFTGGRWAGTVLVPSAGTGLTLTASGGGVAGTSNPFDVGGPASRSPPLARFTASHRVITSGNSVTFDASASSDWQTPAASLTVSWHFEARDADQASAVAPAAAPWTAWSTGKTASHAFVNNTGVPIVYRPRLAVRDTETGPGGPDVGYATGVVVVLPSASGVCVVDTDSLAADNGGSTSCDVRGPDGRLSLAEAIHAANASATPFNVVFDGPRRIGDGAGVSLQIGRPVRIVATPGTVVLDGVSLEISSANVLVSGLELERLATPLAVLPGGEALLEDLHVHDGQGVEVQGRARLVRARMAACGGGVCVRESGAGAYLAVFFSDLSGSGGDVGVSLDACAGAGPTQGGSSPYLAFSNGWGETGAAFVAGTVLTGFGTAIVLGPSTSCADPWITNVTFDGNATGVRRVSGAGGFLHDSVFTRQGAYAVDPGVCAFTSNARNVSWLNAADGCIGAQLVAADPLYVYPAMRDYRLQHASPARDQGNAANAVEVDDAGPGLYLGAAPDRGGRETY